jgi:hypothetical protein
MWEALEGDTLPEKADELTKHIGEQMKYRLCALLVYLTMT